MELNVVVHKETRVSHYYNDEILFISYFLVIVSHLAKFSIELCKIYRIQENGAFISCSCYIKL